MTTQNPSKTADKGLTGLPGVDLPHDKVVGLSIRSDGTLDQNSPEIIGDKDAAIAATKEQFATMAVSAVDGPKRAELGLIDEQDTKTGDAVTDELKATHDKVAAAAEKRAETVIKSLTRD